MVVSAVDQNLSNRFGGCYFISVGIRIPLIPALEMSIFGGSVTLKLIVMFRCGP